MLTKRPAQYRNLCSLEGHKETEKAFLVLLAQWPHFDSIPNSTVKRCCGQDTWGVAPWDNSSVPGSFLAKSSLVLEGFLLFKQNSNFFYSVFY